MKTLSSLIGKRIKDIRESKNIKQVELANIIDIEPTNLSKIEKGLHMPKDETLDKITEALKIDITELLNISHLESKEILIQRIKEFINDASIEDIQFFYRMILAYNESKSK